MSLIWLIILIFSIWLVSLSYLLFRALANYNRLTKGVDSKTLSQLLNDILESHALTQTQIKSTQVAIEQLQKDTTTFFQKVGLIRFNPFADIGGDQSFVLALLDGNNNGIVITSLYSRTGVRWYVKTIKKGKGIEHELSQEEKEALKKAIQSK